MRIVTDTQSLLTADEHIRPQFDRSALLTIDLQADFVTGPYEVPGTEQVVPAVSALVRAFRAASRPIIHIVRLYLPDGGNADICRRSLIASGARLAAPGSWGSGLADGLVSAGRTALDSDRLLSGQVQELGVGEHIIYKPRWSAFYQTPLQEHLADRGVTTLVVAGCNYPNCPRATIYDGSARDYRLVIAADATSGFTDQARGEMTAIGVMCLTVPVIQDLLCGGNEPSR